MMNLISTADEEKTNGAQSQNNAAKSGDIMGITFQLIDSELNCFLIHGMSNRI
jgi:hypothetical protein